MKNLRFLLRGAVLGLLIFTQAPGQGTESDPKVDAAALEQLAKRGNPDAQFELGIRHLKGDGVPKDEAKAAEWLLKAAEQENLDAMNALGTLHEEGVGVPKDAKKAFEWYEKAARYGFPMAQQNLSECYEFGKGVEANPKEAIKWLERAAHQDFAPSQYLYAAKLERGQGVGKDSRAAAEWFLKSAQNGLIRGMTHLAYLYYTGSGVPLDYRRAEAWYRRAARSEDPWARNDLAWFLSVCPDSSFHDPESAVGFARNALEKLSSSRYEMVDTLAAALARSGKFGEAVQVQMKAIVMFDGENQAELPAEDREKLQKELTERLKQYKAQAPFTEKEPKPEPGAKPLIEDRILQEEMVPRRRQRPEPKETDEEDSGKPVVIS